MLITYPQPSLDNLGSIMKVKIIFRIVVNDRYLKKHTIYKRHCLKNKVAVDQFTTAWQGSILDIGAGTGDFLAVAKRTVGKQWEWSQ
jgi:ubiquinone/menaquinone biosynthesis C-methylase UbiE